MIPEAERARFDKELKAKGIKCDCAVCIEREKNSFAIQKIIAGETRSGHRYKSGRRWARVMFLAPTEQLNSCRA